MSGDQQRNNYNNNGYGDRGGRGGYNNGNQYRSVNRGEDGGLKITKNFHNDGGDRNYNNNRDNRDNRGRGGEGWRGRNNYQQGGRGYAGRADAPKKLPGNMMPRKEEQAPPSVMLAQTLMTRLGDYTAMDEGEDVYANIKALATTFVSVGDLQQYPEEISGLFTKCLSQLSVQVPILASLLALVHTQEPQFTGLVADKLQQRLLQAAAEDDVPTAKLVLRSVACLAACGSFAVEGNGGLLELLQDLLSVLTTELDASNNSDARSALQLSAGAQASAFLLASTLMWAAPTLQPLPAAAPFLSAAHAALRQVVARWCSPYSVGGLQAVFSVYNPLVAEEDGMDTAEGAGAAERVLSVGPGAHQDVKADGSAWDALWEASAQAVSLLDVLSTGAAYAYPSYMNAHWVALSAEDLLPADGAKLSFGAQFREDWAAHGRGLGGKAAHCAPSGSFTSVIGSSAAGSWQRLRMVIFDADTSAESAQCCGLSAHAKYTARGYLEDVAVFFDPVINEDGTRLGSMELLAAHLMGVFKLFPADSHLEYLLVETLMQVLLQQPVNATLSSSVFRLLLELCRRHAQVFPPVVALGTNTVFQLVPDLDVGAALEFGRWFSFHLINTQLSWPQHYWDFWVGEMNEAAEAGQLSVPLFVRSIVEHLSYAVIPDKLRPALPQALHALIPPNTPAKCALLASSSEDSAQSMLSSLPGIAELAQQLKTQIEGKADPEDVTDWLEAQSLAEGAQANVCWRGCVLLQTLIHVATAGNDSALSAVVGLLDRYSEPLLTHASTEQDHQDLLSMLREVYGGNHYMYHYMLDEMLRRGQIGVTAAALALCDAGNAAHPAWSSDPCIYECVGSLLDRTVDFVKAAVAQRSQLGGDFCVDETADLTATAAPEEAAAGASAPRKRAAPARESDDMQEDAGAEDDEGEDGERRKRSRRGEDDAGAGAEDSMVMEGDAAAEQAVEPEDDPLWAADEALKSALRNSRGVYAACSSAFKQTICSQAASEGSDAAFIAASLLRRTLRLFHGTERHLSHQHQKRAVISAAGSELQGSLQQLANVAGKEAGVDSVRWLRQLHSAEGR